MMRRNSKKEVVNRILATGTTLLLALACLSALVPPLEQGSSAYALEVAEEQDDGTGPDAPSGLLPAPTIVWPTASDLVYGQTLFESTLVGGSTEYGGFAWVNSAVKPGAPGEAYAVVFTPSEETIATCEPIEVLTQTVFVNVAKASAPTIVWPTAEDLAYGKTVGEATLSGGSTEYGSFQWAPADAVIVPPLGTGDHAVNFVPSADTQANYETIIARTGTVSLTVIKAQPPGLEFPTTSPIRESAGLKLGDVPLLGGAGDGSFAWFEPDFVPKAPGGLYDMVFTPSDLEHYDRVVEKVYLTVISENTPVEDEYDSRYTSDTLTVRVGVLGGRWKTLKTYSAADIWNTFPVYDQEFTWIDNGAFLVRQVVRGVDLRELLNDAIATDDIIGDIGDGSIQVVYFHTKDKAYYTNRSPAMLWGVGQYYFPTLPRDWDFESNRSLYGDSVAWASAVPVSPMIALEEYWHRVNGDEYRTSDILWSRISSGARFRLAWGMPSPTSITGHDSAK
jgi:hypothetical protein